MSIIGADVGSGCLVGMGSRVRGRLEDGSFLAAHSVVPRGVTVRSGELWGGSPARKLKDLSDKQKTQLVYQAEEYVKLGRRHAGVAVLGGNLPMEGGEGEEKLGIGDGSESSGS